MKNIYITAIAVLFWAVGCIPPTEEEITEVNLDFSNPLLQKAYSYVDRQELDSLLQYTSHPDPAYRYLVTLGYSSTQSEGGMDSLTTLLSDPVAKVRQGAAYALGQQGIRASVNPLLGGFKEKDTIDVDNIVNSTILEAIGKTGDQPLLQSLATVSTYRKTDSLLLLGQTRGIYRYALRGMTIPEGTALMIDYVTDPEYPREARLMAAHYLQRANNISIESAQFRLANTFADEMDVDIKMALAAALRKSGDPEILEILMDALDDESNDYRVRVNILKSLSGYEYIQAVEAALKYIGHPNPKLAMTAADYLLQNGISSDATIYRNFIQDSMHYRVQARIFSAVLRHLPYYYNRTKALIRNQVMERINNANDPYEKAAYLEALSYDPLNYNLMKEVGFDGAPVLRTTAMSGLGRILEDDRFARVFRGGADRVKREIAALIKEGIASGDAGMAAIGGLILSNPDLGFETIIENTDFLTAAISNLDLPRETETLQQLEKARAHLRGETYNRPVPGYNHPIDWSTLNTVTDSTFAAIRTSKGVINVELYPRKTPGTVSNFVGLVNDGFYKNKVFHRVVPNFVIQTGCPRGDGYGSLDYSIRSELPQLYYDAQGYIGMASAGNHTEGTQWFITHSPTPHLDGKYTIFGRVMSGMDVVHNIEQGDIIEDILLVTE